jgi:hypothetical protein
MSDLEKMSLGLQAKIGSLLVHMDEAASSDGHHFDLVAIRSLMDEADVVEWMDGLRALALLPVKRSEVTDE